MKTLVLGAGKMVEAILTGLHSEIDLSDWGIYSPSGTSARALSEKIGASFVADLKEVKSVDQLLIGCKPQQLADLANILPGQLKSSLVLSLLAAVTEAEQSRLLGTQKLIRVMPNLSVRFRKGVTLISSSSASDELKKVQDLFSHLGKSLILNEGELEELTLLTGSGPALFYEFARQLSRSFKSLDETEREDLVRYVLLGSGVSAAAENETLSQMIDSVTSKGGVTIAVLEEWRAQRLDKLMESGIERGLERIDEIKKIILQS